MDDLLGLLGEISSIATALATVALVILIWRTVQQLEVTVKESKMRSQRFRPWVGPSDGIKLMSAQNGREQYFVTIKNYGELPASNVTVTFNTKTHEITRKMLEAPNGANSFSLGPLLPNMEKRYWFFIEYDLAKKARDGVEQIFISLYFKYDYFGGSSGYGMISRFDPTIDSKSAFIHKEMWVD